MKKYSILILMSKYHAVSGHTRVVDSLSQELIKIGHKVTLGSFNFEKDPPKGIHKLKFCKSNITKKIKDGKFDLIHNHQTLMNYHLLFTKEPLIFHYHGASSKLQKINLGICSILCRKRINKIISISDSAKKEIQQYFPKTSNSVVYNGVNTNFYKQNNQIPKDNLELLFVGNLFKYKNIQFIINAIFKLKLKFPHIHFKIIGDGIYKKKLFDLINKNNFQNQIQLVGRISDEQLQKYYAASDIYVTASTWEFFNLPLLESMSCGKPILVSDLPVHQELISKSHAGKIFLMNIESFEEKMKYILENYEELSKNARKFALQNDWSKMAQNISDIYEELIRHEK